MSTLTFDVPAVTADLDAVIDSIVLTDLDGNPNSVIDRNVGFRVRADWHLDGTLKSMIAGTWTVRMFVESMGPGPEAQLGSATVPLGANPNYTATINVAPNALPAGPPDSGVYKLVMVITHEAFGVKSEMAGFGDGPLFNVREP
ncbi:MAG: hypothetical protein ACKVWR_13285 [Acidimicrobiales bacterium]